MRVIRLDFATSSSRSSMMGIALLVVGVMLGAVAVFDDSTQSEQLSSLQTQLKRAKTAYQRTQIESGNAANGISLAGFNQADDAVQRLNIPWGSLLNALEQAQNDTIALLGIEPDSGRGSLRLSGEARDLPSLVAYMKSIDGKGGMSAVRLLTQQVKQEDAQHPVVFAIEARWSGLPGAAEKNRL